MHSCMLRLLARPKWLCDIALSCWKDAKRLAMTHVQRSCEQCQSTFTCCRQRIWADVGAAA